MFVGMGSGGGARASLDPRLLSGSPLGWAALSPGTWHYWIASRNLRGSVAAMPDLPLSKKDRVALILAALRDAPAAGNRDGALALMARVFRLVEDEHSGVAEVPFHADRLYPPVAAMERAVDGKPWLRRYRHTGHYTLIADNGAIVIRVFVRGMKDGVMAIVGERTEFDKPGADGGTLAELE